MASFSSARRFAALTILLLFSGCQKQSDPLTATKLFFEELANGQIADAYQGATFNFQTVQSEVSFEARVHEMNLTGAKSQFDPPKITGDTAIVKTQVTPAKGDPLTFLVKLAKEHDIWRVYSIRTPRSLETGLSRDPFSRLGKVIDFEDPTGKPMPDEKTVKELVKANLLEFNRAVRAHTFVDFYNTISEEWKDQITETMLLRTFQGFVDQNVDLSPIEGMEPIFDTPPQFASNGLVVVSGHFPTAPAVLNFTLKFIYEIPTWKLFSLEIDLKGIRKGQPAIASPAPKPAGAEPAAGPAQAIAK